MRTFTMLLAATAATMPVPGWAQDVVVMRRPIAAPKRTGTSQPSGPSAPTPAPTPAPTYAWTTGEWAWDAGTPTCTAKASRTRAVSCVDAGGGTVGDALCGGVRPEAVQTGVDRAEGCSYAWDVGAWSDEGACSATSAGTRAVACLRTDGKTSPASLCTGDAPASTRSERRLEGCTVAWAGTGWSDWSPTCSAAATRSRTVACQASAGGASPFEVEDALCGGERPDVAEGPVAYYGNCSGRWTMSAWSVRNPSCQHGRRQEAMVAQCTRPGGDVDASASSCDPGARPDEEIRRASCAAPGEVMLSGEYAPSVVDAAHPLVNGDVALTVAPDGRPAIVRTSDGTTLWTAAVQEMTPGYQPGGTIYMQLDGNLVLYNPSSAGGGATWHTSTWGAIASYAILTPSGVLEVRHPDTGQALYRAAPGQASEFHWNPFERRYVP
jgi:hypothetical protein